MQVLAAANTLDMEGFAFFLRGGTVLDRSTQPANPDPAWITEDAWDNLTELEGQVRFPPCRTPTLLCHMRMRVSVAETAVLQTEGWGRGCVRQSVARRWLAGVPKLAFADHVLPESHRAAPLACVL